MAHDHVGLPAAPVEEWLPVLERPETSVERVQLFVGRERGLAVGTLTMHLPKLDNLTVVSSDVHVHPEHRRLGYGRLLAQHLITQTRAAGRTRIFTAVPHDPPLALRLLEEVGAKPVIVDTRRMLDLQQSPPVAVGAVPSGYRIVQWLERAPDDIVDGLAYLSGRMTLDAPMGEMDYEQEKWDATRYREQERVAVERKQVRVATAAVHESGDVAGLTEVAVKLTAPEVGEQWETIVDPKHRGHGLGLVLKSRNHVQLAERLPGCRYLNTWNAASNSFMIRVNDALGYRPMESWTEYQLDL